MSDWVVTGAAGNVGGRVAALLIGKGLKVGVVGRSESRLAPLVARGALPLIGSLEDPGFLEKTLTGARGAFIMVPPDYRDPSLVSRQDRIVRSLAGALGTTRVPRVVALSSVGADRRSGTGPIVSLHRLEESLGSLDGLGLVSLRATFFMENHLGSIGLIKGHGINGSLLRSDLRIPQVATRDIARVAAELLLDEALRGKTVRYVLGPRDYTPAEATRILGRAIDKPDLEYVQFGDQAMRDGLIGAGFAAEVADLFLEMYRAFNEGLIHFEPRSVANTTETTLEQFAAETFAPAFGA